MAILERVARHGGTPWEQALYFDAELPPDEGVNQAEAEATVARFLSQALDDLGVDHVIHGGFDQIIDVSFFSDWENRVAAGAIPFEAADSNLLLSEFGVANDGHIAGNVAMASAEEITQEISWRSVGDADIDKDINRCLDAVGKNMGFPENENETPGLYTTCGQQVFKTPTATSLSGPFTNICGEEADEPPSQPLVNFNWIHNYRPCVGEHMQIVDKPPLTVEIESGGCSDALAGPCTTATVGPSDGGQEPPGGGEDPPSGGGTDPIVWVLVAIIVLMLLTGSN